MTEIVPKITNFLDYEQKSDTCEDQENKYKKNRSELVVDTGKSLPISSRPPKEFEVLIDKSIEEKVASQEAPTDGANQLEIQSQSQKELLSEYSPTHLDKANRAISWEDSVPLISNLELPKLKEYFKPMLEPVKTSNQTDIDLSKYAYLYKARYNDPNHYKDDEYFKSLAEELRQKSMRSEKNWIIQDFTEWYTCVRKTTNRKYIASLDTNKDIQVKKV